MTINEILDLLPEELLVDEYFKNIRNIIENLYNKDARFLTKILVSKEIYDSLSDKSCFWISTEDSILNLKFSSCDSVCSLGIKHSNDSLVVYFETSSFNKLTRTILVKREDMSAVETKETIKEKGFYKDYKANIYFYDADYNILKVNVDPYLDKMFSEEFGIESLGLARLVRKNFSHYAESLSYKAAEQKMKIRDNSLTMNDFFYFRRPWIVSLVEDFIREEYDCDKNEFIKKIFGTDSKKSTLIDVNKISSIISWIKSNLDLNSEFVISDNIYQNLVTVMVGTEAPGYCTKGVILEKKNEEYIFYKVFFSTETITCDKKIITKEEAQQLFLSNPKNQKVKDLAAFFGITRGR